MSTQDAKDYQIAESNKTAADLAVIKEVLAGKKYDEPVELLDPGFYLGFDDRKYHRLPYVSNSYLTKLDDCPAAAWVKEPENTPTLVRGRAFHCYTLEGQEEFNRKFAVLPLDCKRSTKAAKEGKAAFMSFHADKEIITADQYVNIKGMGDVVKMHPSAKIFLSAGMREVTIIFDYNWKDGYSIRCKCRIDLIPTNAHGVLADLKSTANAEEGAFLRSVATYGYAKQAAMYLYGINAVCKQYAAKGEPSPFPNQFDTFALIATESSPPYRTEVYELDKESEGIIEWGGGEFYRLMEIERQCRETKQPDGSVKPFYPPWKNAGVSMLTKPNWWI